MRHALGCRIVADECEIAQLLLWDEVSELPCRAEAVRAMPDRRPGGCARAARTDEGGEGVSAEERVILPEDYDAVCAERDTLRELVAIAHEACVAYHDWRGQASTFQAADDTLRRLETALRRAGYEYHGNRALEWRGALLDAMKRAGIACDDTGVIRLRLRSDSDCNPPSGLPVKQVIREWRELLDAKKVSK